MKKRKIYLMIEILILSENKKRIPESDLKFYLSRILGV